MEEEEEEGRIWEYDLYKVCVWIVVDEFVILFFGFVEEIFR